MLATQARKQAKEERQKQRRQSAILWGQESVEPRRDSSIRLGIFKRFTCYRNLSRSDKGWRPVTAVTLSAFVTGIMRRLANYDGHLHAQNTL